MPNQHLIAPLTTLPLSRSSRHRCVCRPRKAAFLDQACRHCTSWCITSSPKVGNRLHMRTSFTQPLEWEKIISCSLYCNGVLAYYDSRSISPALPSSCSCQRPIIWSSKLEARKASLDLINDPLYEGPKHNLGESAVLKSVHRSWG